MTPPHVRFLSTLAIGILAALAYASFGAASKERSDSPPSSPRASRTATAVTSPQFVRQEWQRLEDCTDALYAQDEKLRDFTSVSAPSSARKNRYSDILPFEHSRVRIGLAESGGIDYINANYIAGTRFIATQAPLPTTFADFWRMAWEQHSTVLVMLTRLTEGGRTKADMYWPEKVGVPSSFGVLTVELLEESLDRHTHTHVRKLCLCEGAVCRTVHQLHYVGWPDFDVPESVIDIIALIERSTALSGSEGTIIVHCSAGVGRAGTFIAASMHIANPKLASVTDTVLQLRQARPGMVQREPQFGFIFKILEAYSATRK